MPLENFLFLWVSIFKEYWIFHVLTIYLMVKQLAYLICANADFNIT